MNKSPSFYNTSDDPLSDHAIEFLSKCVEENEIIEFKLELDLRNEKTQYEFAKDVSAFANASGGYFIIGKKPNYGKTQSIDEHTRDILCESDEICKKINSCIEPNINNLRAKLIEIDGVVFCFIHIPCTGKIHFIKRDCSVGVGTEKRTILKKGTAYYRASGRNELVTSAIFEEIISKRLNTYRSELLKDIRRVVEAPPNSVVLIQNGDTTTKEPQKVKIEDGPDSIAVHGMSFTATAQNYPEEIAQSISLHKRRSDNLPSLPTVLQWYKSRDNICTQITQDQKLNIAIMSALLELPVFYWTKDLTNEQIHQFITSASEKVQDNVPIAVYIVRLAAAFNKRQGHRAALKILGKQKLHATTTNYPNTDPRDAYFRMSPCVDKLKREGCDDATMSDKLNSEIDSIINQVATDKWTFPGFIRSRLITLDCCLYSKEKY